MEKGDNLSPMGVKGRVWDDPDERERADESGLQPHSQSLPRGTWAGPMPGTRRSFSRF